MGISTNQINGSSIANALFPKVRQRVLAVLFCTTKRSFYANEVVALAASGTGAVQRELANLSGAGLLIVSKQDNQKHYQANANAPVFAELRGLVLKTMGLPSGANIMLPHVNGWLDAEVSPMATQSAPLMATQTAPPRSL